MQNGDFVLIRTYSAGVHYGILEEWDGKMVKLSSARRIWKWSGALSLSEIAMNGVNVSNSNITVPVDEIVLTEAIEIIKISKSSNLPGNEIARKGVSAKL